MGASKAMASERSARRKNTARASVRAKMRSLSIQYRLLRCPPVVAACTKLEISKPSYVIGARISHPCAVRDAGAGLSEPLDFPHSRKEGKKQQSFSFRMGSALAVRSRRVPRHNAEAPTVRAADAI